MFIKQETTRYRDIGLKKFNELKGAYFKDIPATFNSTFAFAKLVASSPPIFTKIISSPPIYTRV